MCIARKETEKQKEKKGAHDRNTNTFLHNLIIKQNANDRFNLKIGKATQFFEMVKI